MLAIGQDNAFPWIEREVELGGAIHSKGMLILSSALTSHPATKVLEARVGAQGVEGRVDLAGRAPVRVALRC